LAGLGAIHVVELGGEAAARAGRVLADLGARVTRVSPAGRLDPLAARRSAWLAWTYGKELVTLDDDGAAALAATADVVIDTPREPSTIVLDPACAPNASWVRITPFGLDGPRAQWRATDLGVMAASGNMYPTGSPERPPVRAVEPTSLGHVGGEAAFAALTAIASGRPQVVDLSTQECVTIANMGGPGRFFRSGYRGQRIGARIGPTREIWPTADGFVSFGIRGGASRAPSMRTIAKLVQDAGIDEPLLDQDWPSWAPEHAPQEELDRIEAAIATYFSTRTMSDLYETAVATNLMLAPANTPRELVQSAQLLARDFFIATDEVGALPRSSSMMRSRATEVSSAPARVARPASPWEGVHILELGAGAAGPIASRYFVEQGATVIRIESSTRPDFLRAMAIGARSPYGLEGSELFDALNCGKRDVTLNLKHPDAVALVKRLVIEWADAVAENFAPRAMASFGLDYESLAAIAPGLVMISACLNGQTGPHKDYPGFGGQGSALSGWNWVTGWPDGEPTGPFATITDSLAPRYVAAALAAGLLHRRATGEGVYVDVAQVECGAYALSPWIADYGLDGTIGTRDGNRSKSAVPHGAFPCVDEGDISDRWVAVACHSDDDWARLAKLIDVDDPSLATFAARLARVDEVEQRVASYTATRTRADVVGTLQAEGIEAVPIQDFADVFHDEQLAHRGHFVEMEHPVMGPGTYERSGIRCSDATAGYDRPAPTLNQDGDWVLRELLGLDDAEITRLKEAGALD
jgi:crotonobetainyl-CoA:carnitine CoA-transferase CaiB-like acyl-CoA transferase